MGNCSVHSLCVALKSCYLCLTVSYHLDRVSINIHSQKEKRKQLSPVCSDFLYVEAFQQLASSILSLTACAMLQWWKLKVFLGLFWEWVQLWACTWPQLSSISRTFKKSYSPCVSFFNCFLPKFYNVPLVYPVLPRPSLLQSILQPNTGREVVASQKSSWLTESHHTDPSGSCKTGWNT